MIRRITVMAFALVFAALCLLPASAPAEDGAKVIRVGWYETPFNHKDSFGRRTGYAYEYQRKIAAYTGWKYEYVEGNWSELMQMLQDGRIDLMSDVSFTEARTEHMLFSSIPMGSEFYYLFIAPDNTEITVDSYASLNGKKVGVTKTSVQRDFFQEWATVRGIDPELVELECSEEESLSMLGRGEIDAFVTLDTYGDPERALPLWRIGSSDFYFAVSKNQPELLTELDAALNRIQEENKYYSDELAAKYLTTTGTSLYLSADEKAWLETHGPIRVGYQDNYLAFCAADPVTGELTGALKDYLAAAAGTLANAEPEFVTVAYPTASAALEALVSGEVDCMFPANLTDYDGELSGVVMTAPLMRTEMEAVVREADKKDFLRSSRVRVGVNQGNPNYEMFLVEHFPSWTPVLYTDTPACLERVAAGDADCIIISNYRYCDIARQCQRLGLTTVFTGVEMDYCLAVAEGSTTLYSILSRMIHQVPESLVNAALTYYSTEISEPGLLEYLQANPVIAVLIVFCLALIVVLAILSFRLWIRQKRN